MKTQHTNITSKRNKNKLLRFAASGILLAVLFVCVFSGVLASSFAVQENAIENGQLEANVADASGQNNSTLIDLSNSIDYSKTSININPNVSKRGRYYSTDADHTTNCTWSTGNGTTGGTWAIGDTSYHGVTLGYAHCWFDYDLGADWEKYSKDITIRLTTTKNASSNLGGYMIAIRSNTDAFDQITDGSTGYNTDVKNFTSSGNNTITKTGENPNNNSGMTLDHPVTGRYIRIYLVTWDQGYLFEAKYGNVTLSGVKVTLIRTKKDFEFTYNKNNSSATGTVTSQDKTFSTASTVQSAYYSLTNYVQKGWNTSNDGGGVSIGFGGSYTTSTAANTIGAYIKSKLTTGAKPSVPLYAVWQEIGFTFNGTDYNTYSGQELQVLITNTGGTYLSGYNNPNSYTTTITYKLSSAGDGAYSGTKPTAKGVYNAKLEVKDGSSNVRGTRIITFTITEGDFGMGHLPTNTTTDRWGAIDNPYLIQNVDHLNNLVRIVNHLSDPLNSTVGSDNNNVTASDVVATDITYSGCYFLVSDNIDASTIVGAIGKDATYYFAGYFKGNNKTITLPDGKTALFGYIKQNDKTVNSVLVKTTVENLTIAVASGGKLTTAGLVATLNGGVITNCTNTATINGATNVGGLVGTVTGTNTTVIQNSKNSASVTNTNASYAAGGIVGSITASGTTSVTVSHCYNSAEIKSNAKSGGIIGNINTSSGTLKVEYCASEGKLTLTSSGVSGAIIGGYTTNNLANISYCYSPNGKPLFGADISSTYSWTFVTEQDEANYTNATLPGNYNKYVLVTSGTVAPRDKDYPTTSKEWADIVSTNLNSFLVTVSVADGEFFASGVGPTGLDVKPYTIQTAYSSNPPSVGALYWCSLTTPSTPSNVLYVGAKTISVSNKYTDDTRTDLNDSTTTTGYVYNGNILGPTIEGAATAMASGTFSNPYAAKNSTAVAPSGATKIGSGGLGYNASQRQANAGTYFIDVNILITAGDGATKVVGHFTRTYTINKRALTTANTWTDGTDDTAAATEPGSKSITTTITKSPNFTFNGLGQGVGQIWLYHNLVSYANSNTTSSTQRGYSNENIVSSGNVITTSTASSPATIFNTGLTNYRQTNQNTYSYVLGLTSAAQANYTINGDTSVTFTYTIDRFDLSSSSDFAHCLFGYAGTLVSNSAVPSNSDLDAWTGYYALINDKGDKRADSTFENTYKARPSLVYYYPSEYNVDNFKIRITNGTSTPFTHTGNFTIQYYENSSLSSGLPSVNNTTPEKDAILLLTGQGNFTGYLTVRYRLMLSDFDGAFTAGNWGSQSNPFVISNLMHLIRLSDIVNGAKPWNSTQQAVDNTYVASNITTVNMNDNATRQTTYANAYFTLGGDFTDKDSKAAMTSLGFHPIGDGATKVVDDHDVFIHYFAGTFDGQNHTVGIFITDETDYVGLFGHTIGATIKNLKITKTNRENQGANTSSVYNHDGVYATGDYVGGIVGRGTDTTLQNVHNLIAISASGVDTSQEVWAVASIVGRNYVGGIAGALDGSSTVQSEGNMLSVAHIYGQSYVGGLVGSMQTSGTLTLTPYVGFASASGASSRIHISGSSFVGSVFGAFKGGSTRSTIYVAKHTVSGVGAHNIDTCIIGNGTGKVVGGVVGYASNVNICLASDDISTAYYFRTNGSTDENATYINKDADGNGCKTSFWGGFVGVLGAGATIKSLEVSGVYASVRALHGKVIIDDDYADSYVGGIVGYISPSAGESNGTNNVFGYNVAMRNYSDIVASGNYIGGIVGYLGVASEGAPEGYALADFIPLEIAADIANGELEFNPNASMNSTQYGGKAQDFANVKGANFVGGIVGCVAYSNSENKGAWVEFVNTPLENDVITTTSTMYVFVASITTTQNTSTLGSDISFVATGSNVGGIIGAIVGGKNKSKLQYIFATATVASKEVAPDLESDGIVGASNVGGFVGSMEGLDSSIINCFFARVAKFGSSTNNAYNNPRIFGGEYVGGVVGRMKAGLVKDCIVMGFAYDYYTDAVRTKVYNETRSGVVGGKEGGSATVESSWAIYYVQENSASNTIDSARGNGLIIDNDESYIFEITYQEIGFMVGVFESITTANKKSTDTLAATQGYISVKVQYLAVSQQSFVSSNQRHIVLYDENGEPYNVQTNFENSNFTSTNRVICLKLAFDKPSYSICLRKIEFKNVKKDTGNNNTNKTNLANSFYKPANNAQYAAVITTAPTYTNSYISAASGSITLNGKTVGEFNYTFTVGDPSNPYVIETPTDWNTAASNINSGVNTTAYYVLRPKTGDTLALGTLSASQLWGNADNHFAGTFDGEGHTISFSYTANSQMIGLSLFRNAGGSTRPAVFKNLTISGSINAVGAIGSNTSDTSYFNEDESNSRKYYNKAGNAQYTVTYKSYRVAGFVGYPSGDVVFLNCTNKVNVQASMDAGGFVGESKSGVTVTIVDCINGGNITTYLAGRPYGAKENLFNSNGTPKTNDVNWAHGTGGFIGNALGTSVLDSCRNNGAISGGQNVGGIVGRTNKGLDIYNCVNTGNILAHSGYNAECTKVKKDLNDKEAKSQSGTRNWLNYAGGILGKTSGNARLGLYSSYNSGEVVAYGNVAGGLVGGIGDYYVKVRGLLPNVASTLRTEHPNVAGYIIDGFDVLIASFEGFGEGSDPDYSTAAKDSVISYCYNEGDVYTGGKTVKVAESWGARCNSLMCGTICGGIVGIFGGGTVSYCYNAGTVTSNGIDGYSFEWHVRVGGIIGQAQPSSTGPAYINHCYNVGEVKSTMTNGDDKMSGGQFLGTGSHIYKNCVMYGGCILGYIEDPTCDKAKKYTFVSDCYSLSGTYQNSNYDTSKAPESSQGAVWEAKGGTRKDNCEWGIDACDYAYTFTIDFYFGTYDIKCIIKRPKVHNCSSGVYQGSSTVTLLSLDELTAVMDSNGVILTKGAFASGGTSYDMTNTENGTHETVTTKYNYTSKLQNKGNGDWSSAATLVNANGTYFNSFDEENFSVSYNNTAFINGTAPGWIYVYGCLPQLAVFGLGTKKGMSMLSVSYGYNNDTLAYEAASAGDKVSPYIVKDGMHLLSMVALTSAKNSVSNNTYYSFENKYIEVASGANNISGDTVTDIYLPTSATKPSTDNNGTTTAYKGYSSSTEKYIMTKSFTLMTKGAMYSNAWNAKNYSFNGSSLSRETGDGVANANFYPIGGLGDHAVFKGNFDGKGVVIHDLKMQWNSDGNLDLGLFGRTQNATIKNIKINGSIDGYKTGSSSSAVIAVGGIVGRTGSGTTIENCEIGYTSGNTTYGVTLEAHSSNLVADGYVGGVVGVLGTLGFVRGSAAPAQTTAASATVKDCKIVSATIKTFKNGVGGIAGYSLANVGDVTNSGANALVDGCDVLNATIGTVESGNAASLGINAGGVIGTMDDYVNLTIQNTHVGTSGASGIHVTIYGQNSIGGIIGASGKNLVIQGTLVDSVQKETAVYEDVLIERRDSWTTVRNNDDYGTAIGGFVGYTPTTTSNGTPSVAFAGTLRFVGTIDSKVATSGENAYIQDVGGVAGFMGAGTSFASGTNITVGGTIDIGTSTSVKVKNIGGIAGEVYNTPFSGTFTSAPNIIASNGENVGGFVGYVSNECTVLANGTVININGNISAKTNVGGFIGAIDTNGALKMGTASGDSGTITVTIKSTNATMTIEGSGNNIGGIVGYNGGTAQNKGVYIYTATITNNGTVQKKSGVAAADGGNYVGGIIGDNNGRLTISSANAKLTNNGTVTGNNYVGGSIGRNNNANFTIGAGAEIKNTGTVTGVDYVGGVVGLMNSGTLAGSYANGDTVGGVVKGDVVGSSYVGGVIGAMKGTIAGTSGSYASFTNIGSVTGAAYVGGAIGVLAGNTEYANFLNRGTVATTNSIANVAIGGAIGVIGGAAIGVNSNLTYQHTHAEYATTDGTQKNLSVANALSGSSGVGGVIGIISDKVTTYNDNSFYVNGNVTARSIVGNAVVGCNNVGGVIGSIEANNVQISNLLAYDTLVQGLNNVGGIVGSITGTGASILNSFNVMVSSGNVVGTSNVGGIVGLAYVDENDETNGTTNSTDAHTSYWVKGYQNDELASLDITKLNTELGKYVTIKLNIGVNNTQVVLNKSFFELYAKPSDYEAESSVTLLGEDDEDNWEDYLEAKIENTPALSAVYDLDTVTKTGETTWYRYEVTDFEPFTTGSENTGWYFLYSNDFTKRVGSVDENLIETEFAASGNLAYWKYIANCYAKTNDDVPTSGLTSGIVYNNASIIGGADYLYARAEASNQDGYYLYVANSGDASALTKNIVGYNDANTAPGDSNSDRFENLRLYLKVDKSAGAAENVVIYYRNVAGGAALTYNGYQRYAPLNVNAKTVEMPFSLDASTAKGRTSGQYTYMMLSTTNNTLETTGSLRTHVGSYTSEISIYIVDNHKIYKVGGSSSIKWSINAKHVKLQILANGNQESTQSPTYGVNGSYDGGGTGAGVRGTDLSNSANTLVVKVGGAGTAAGISSNDGSDNNGNYVVINFAVQNIATGAVYHTSYCVSAPQNNPTAEQANLGLPLDEVWVTYGTVVTNRNYNALTTQSGYTASTASRISADDACCDTNISASYWDTYQFVFHFAKAKNYKITVTLGSSLTANDRSHNYRLQSANPNAELHIQKITLATNTLGEIINNSYSGTAATDYDGVAHNNTFTIGTGSIGSTTNWASEADMQKYAPLMGLKVVYKPESGSEVSTGFTYTSGVLTSIGGVYTFLEGRATDYRVMVDGFLQKGTYYLEITTTTFDNYIVSGFNNSNRITLYTIANNAIDIYWSDTDSHHEKFYDKKAGTTVVTFESSASKQPFADLRAYVNDNFVLTDDNGTTFTLSETNSEYANNGTNLRKLVVKPGYFNTPSVNVKLTNNGEEDVYEFTVTRDEEDPNVAVTFSKSNGQDYVSTDDDYSTLSYKIKQKQLTLKFNGADSTSIGTFTYNLTQQGLVNFSVLGLVVAGNGVSTGDSVTIASSGTASGDVGAIIKVEAKITPVGKSQTSISNPCGTGTVSGSGNPATINIADNKFVHAGSYTFKVSMQDSTNYKLTAKTASWTINRYKLTVGIASGSTTYDGNAHVPSTTFTAGESVSGTTLTKISNTQFRLNNSGASKNETRNITLSYTKADNPATAIVNYGTYTVTVNSVDSASSTYNDYELYNCTPQTYAITQQTITITGWNNEGSGSPKTAREYVYSGNPQGPYINGISIGTTPKNGTKKSDTTSEFNGQSSEKITITINGIQTNIGNNLTASYVSFAVSGTNAAGSTSNDDNNYIFATSSKDSEGYKIVPSLITVTISAASISKTYDGETSATVLESDLTKTSTNGGANACTLTSISATYDTAAAGTGKTVTCTFGVSGSNYQLNNTEATTTVGTIERAHIIIVLNTRGGKAYKTYDGSATFGEWNNSGNARTRTYRTGQGFTVSGVISGEINDATKLTISADFAEAGSGREKYNAYINSVEKNNENKYVVNGTHYKKLVFTLSGTSAPNYYCSVYSHQTSEDHSTALRRDIGKTISAAAVSTFDIFDSRDTTNRNSVGQNQDLSFNITINKRSVTADYDHLTQSYATADNKFNTEWVRVTGTSSGIVDANVDIAIMNGWMFADGHDTGEEHDDDMNGDEYVRTRAVYTSYTTIKGSTATDKKEILSASIVDSGNNGHEINYTLRNQPTLIIGYFVVKEGQPYEISSMAGLMLATYYYRMNFVTTQYDGEEGDITGASSIVMWHKLITGDTYETGTGFASFDASSVTQETGVPSLTNYTFAEAATSWDDFFTKYITAYNADSNTLSSDAVIEFRLEADPTNGGEWGFWAKVKTERIKYMDFIQVGDISGVLTADDIAILDGQIGSGSWASYFPNFIQTTKGNIPTAIGSIFRSEGGLPFIGSYDGDGYIINNINIVDFATSSKGGTYNIGMFASVGSGSITDNGETTSYDGSVTNVNLRNVNIVFSDGNSVATEINVGGIIGLSQQVYTMENSSFHGIITINSANKSSTINVGGLIGKYDASGIQSHMGGKLAVSGAITLGSVYVETSGSINAGGIVGNFKTTAAETYTVKDMVSMLSVYSKAADNKHSIGGIIGTTVQTTSPLTATSGKTNAYLKDAMVNVDGSNPNNIIVATATEMIGGSGTTVQGTTYSDLISGSNSGYLNGETIVNYLGKGQMGSNVRGQYDMLDDHFISKAQKKKYESPRLVDIVKIYVLLYTRQNATAAIIGSESNVPVYTISATSWLVGDKLGTNSSKFDIYNIQQVAFLREFRFASFTLARDINMYTHYDMAQFVGTFYGYITAGGHTIDLVDVDPKKMFETEPTELSAHAIPIKQ